MNILNLKDMCFLAYCHNMLKEAEEQYGQDKGVIVIENQEDLKNTKALGVEVLRYLESINCTKSALSNKINAGLKPLAHEYYKSVVKSYYEHFGNKVIPLLFAITGIEALQEKGVELLEMSKLEDIKKHFLNSKHLEKKETYFMGKKRIKNLEVLKYSDCIENTFKSLDKVKLPKRIKKRKRK